MYCLLCIIVIKHDASQDILIHYMLLFFQQIVANLTTSNLAALSLWEVQIILQITTKMKNAFGPWCVLEMFH